jgi:hypothetical protein
MSRLLRVVMFAVVCGLLLVGPVGSPSQAGATGRTAQVAQVQDVSSGWSSARTAKHKKHHKHKKKHHKHKKHKKSKVSRCWPSAPSVGAVRVPGGVLFRWNYTSCTTRYRVHVSPAWWGEWPGNPYYTPWVGATARGTVYRAPASPRPGDGMVGVAYANPVFAELEANNGANTRKVATHKSKWLAAWSGAPAPAAGDPVRFGSYNVMLNPTGSRAAVVGRNIGSHGLTMVALQEANQNTAADVTSTLNADYPGTWSWVRESSSTVNTPQQIVYRSDLFSLEDSGILSRANPKDSAHPVLAPYARFHAVHSGGGQGRPFYVSSVHIADSGGSSLQTNAATGGAATVIASFFRSLTSDPVIVAGDLRYGREPWGERTGYVPAQPTFIRSGYYDAMASQSMHGQNYSTVNITGGKPSAHQTPHPSGAGPRSDHILMRGIRGSKTYYNVADWSYGGVVPSDHNLILSDIMIPQS